MKILITGATGFIGLKLVDALHAKGHELFALCRDKVKAKKLLPEKCHVIIGDITNRDSLKGCCEGIDMVYQLVAQVGNDLPSELAMKKFRKVNVDGLQNIVDEAKRAGVKRFISVSSIAAMGIVKKMPISAQSKCEPYLPYQKTKREGELLILKEVKENNFPGIIVRPAKVYGVGEKEYSYLSIAKLCKKGFFPKVGLGDTMVSHCYIDDLVTNLVLLTERGKIGEIYIFATDKSIGFYQSVELIAKELDKKVIFLPVPKCFMKSVAYGIELIYNVFGKKAPVTRRNVMAATTDRIYDFTKNKHDLGFVSNVAMEEGIKRVLSYYKQENLL